MTHIALQESVDGKVVGWMEPVSKEQYPARTANPSIPSGARGAFLQRGTPADQLPAADVTLLPLNEAAEQQRAASVDWLISTTQGALTGAK